MLKRAYAAPANIAAKTRRWMRALAPYARPAPPLRVRRAALLVVDMQTFFLDADSPARLPAAAAALPAIRRLIEAARAAQRPVAYTVYASAAKSSGHPMRRWWRRPCPPNSRWAKLGGELRRERGEKVFAKAGYSALRATRLHAWLRTRRITDLIVTGVLTNLCVESTVRDAFDAGYRVFVAPDACAAATEDMHLGSLKNMVSGFAFVEQTQKLFATMTNRRGG
ncbi:MAG: isochorismatase family cysteine hydrolase [Elusimicrobiota bacterium]